MQTFVTCRHFLLRDVPLSLFLPLSLFVVYAVSAPVAFPALVLNSTLICISLHICGRLGPKQIVIEIIAVTFCITHHQSIH